MKKLTALAALLLAVSAGTTAFATTEYDPTYNSVTNTDQSSYQTVLITAGDGASATDTNVVYIDQAATAFDGARSFFLKQNPATGVYTIRFGGSDGQTTTAKFVIGVGVSGYDTELAALPGGEVETEDGIYSLSFATSDTGVELSNGAIILVKTADVVMAYPVDSNIHITGPITAILGVQIDEVPKAQKDNVKVYLRQGGDVTTSESAGE